MDEYISHVPYRREEWKGHASKRAVRQAIAYDRGSGRLRIFTRGVNGNGDVFFLEVPRDQWDELLSD